MRRIFIALLLALAGAGISQAQVSPIRGWCESGAQQVVLAGLNSTTQVQASFPQCTVTVSIHGDGAATIFADANSTPLGNPFTAQTNGQWIFYVTSGRYDVQLSGAGFPTPITYSDIFTSGAGGATVIPGGSPIQTQVNNNGTFGGTPCENFGNILTGPQNIDCDTRFKGPNPYVDSRRYGVRALFNVNAIPAISGITATATGGSPAVTVSTASCPVQTGNVCFVNGDGVVIANAGAANTLTVPQTVTVTPSNAQVGTQTGSVVNAPTGATTYNYRIFACDVGGGCGPASTAVSTTTGTASLGAQSQAGYSATRSNDTETFTVGSQPAFSVGTVVLVDTPTGSLDTDFMGFKLVSTVTGTGFTVAGVPLDTRNGARLVSNGTYTIHWFNLNHVTWTAPASGSPFRYFACSDRATPGTYHVIGPARLPVDPHNSTYTKGTLEFDDFGSTMMAASASVVPWYVSDANCTAGSATNDNWVTTILSGAGTTALTMTASAPNSSGAGVVIRFDNAPNLKTAVSTAYTAGNGPSVALPWDPAFGAYVFNSVTDLSANDPILLFPIGAQFNDTLILGGAAQMYGNVMVGKGSTSGFQPKSVPTIIGAGLPNVMVGSSTGSAISVWIEGLKFAAPDNGVAVLSDGGGGSLGSTYTNDQFTSGFTSADYLGIAFACRGVVAGSCTGSWKGKNLFVGGSQNMAGLSNTPTFVCDECGSVTFEEVMSTGRGFFMGFAADAGMTVRIGHSDSQGISTPLVTLSRKNSGNAGAQLWLGDAGQVLLDTVTQSCVVYLPTSTGNLSLDFKDFGGCIPSGGVPRTSGQRMNNPGIEGGFASTQNRDSAGLSSGLAMDGILAVAGGNVLNYPVFVEQAAHATSTTYPIYVQAAAMAQPTCSVSAGGSVSIASHTYQVAPVWWNNGVDKPSVPSTACVTSSGQQTVTVNWTVPPGNPKGFEVYEDGTTRLFTGVVCNSLPQITPGTVSSVVINADTACPLNISQVSAGGPSMLMPGTQGIATPAMVLAGSQPVTAIQGTDTSLLSSGTISASTGISLCTDANHGATTSGCPSAGTFYQTVDANATAQTQRPILNLISGTNATVSCVDNAGATRTDCTFAANATTLWSSITAATNSNAGTFAATGNTWDFSGATSFKVPVAGGAAPTADGTIADNSTTHGLNFGSNGNTLNVAIASTGAGGTGTTCAANSAVTALSNTAAPTCTQLTGGGLPYTNWGVNSSCAQTGSGAGNTQTCTISFNTTEANTSYKIVCGGTGTITGYPFMQGVITKNTTNAVVQYTNGTSNEAVVSGWANIECIVTR